MAKTLLCQNHGSSIAAGAVTYKPIAGRGSPSTTEAQKQVPCYSAGEFTDLNVFVRDNNLDNATVVTLRIDTGSGPGDGTNTVSIASTLTGYFADVTHSDSISSGDKVDLKIDVSASSSGTILVFSSIAFSATSNTAKMFVLGNNTSFSRDVETVVYWPIAGEGDGQTINENQGFTFKTAGTLRYASWYVSVNARTVSTTMKTRIGGSDGNISIVAAASTTGLLQDVSNTDSISVDDFVNLSATSSPAETPNLTGTVASIEFITTDNTFQIIPGSVGTQSQATGLTRYYGLGSEVSPQATEADMALKTPFDFTASNLSINIISNASTTNGSIKLFVEGSGSALTATLTALTTGVFADNSNEVAITTDDTLSIELISGATGGYTLGSMGFKGTTASVASTIKTNTLTLLGVG